MKLHELSVEIDGIVGTISQYTMNPYVMGYAQTLRKAIETDDMDILEIATKKLLQWYDNNLEKILSNQYINNKQDHIKTKAILTETLESIGMNISTS